MGIVSQSKDGEYLVTVFDNGAIERVINQEGKPAPKIVAAPDKFADLNAKIDTALSEIAAIKALLNPK